MSPRQPRYPVFVPSKGRHDACLTMRALHRVGIPFTAVVEPQEEDAYRDALDRFGISDPVLVLPHRDEGLVVTRNWIWDHAQALEVPRFWTMDDNISGFYRYNHNLKVEVGDSSFLAALEDFTDRYENVPIAGMQYHMFVTRKMWWPPLAFNTRVYSNMLIETNARSPKTGELYRNEGFYNDDTDLCLRVLKDGLCTVLFNAFLIYKETTMTHAGGMTEHYLGDGRWKMAEELRQKHPDVTTITEKWGRWQHHVDYRRFKSNEPRLRPGVDLSALPEVDNYGMELIDSRAEEAAPARPLLRLTDEVAEEMNAAAEIRDEALAGAWEALSAARDPLDWDDEEELTGDCSQDCLEACAYPGRFSECSIPLPEVDPNPQPPVDPEPQPEVDPEPQPEVEAPAGLFDLPPAPPPAHHRATVHFESEEDIAAFVAATGIVVYPTTKTVTYSGGQPA